MLATRAIVEVTDHDDVHFARPLHIKDVQEMFTRDGNRPMVTLSKDGVARVSYPQHIDPKTYDWE